MAGNDGCLEGVKAAPSAQLARSGERLHPAANLDLIPECPVLVQT
jgi:hypothetical protein